MEVYISFQSSAIMDVNRGTCFMILQATSKEKGLVLH